MVPSHIQYMYVEETDSIIFCSVLFFASLSLFQGAEDAEEMGATFKLVAKRAVHVVRDMDPSDSLNFVRLRTANKELMIGVDNEYTVIIQQRWTPAAV